MFKEYQLFKLAAQKMIDDNCLFLDTETTGLDKDDEIVELGIIDCSGKTLYSSLFQPEKEINPEASKVSGLTNELLINAPKFKDEFAKIMSILNGRPVAAFNEPFDERMFFQTGERYGLDMSQIENAFSQAICSQRLYDHYLGYKRTKLEFSCAAEDVDMVQKHRAVGDCQMTLALMQKVADQSRTPDLDKYVDIKAEKFVQSIDPNFNSEPVPAVSIFENLPSYLDMFKAGMSVDEMAQHRGVRRATAEMALIDLFEKKYIDDISFLIDPKYINDILDIAQNENWDKKLQTIKDQVPEECSYACIKAVLAADKRGMIERTEPMNKGFVVNDLYFGMDDDRECVEGHLAPTPDLIQRMRNIIKDQHTPEVMQTVERINFYPNYNLWTCTATLSGAYCYSNGDLKQIGKFDLPLSEDEAADLIDAMEACCQREHDESCTVMLNKHRTAEGRTPISTLPDALAVQQPKKKNPLDLIISGARQKSISPVKEDLEFDDRVAAHSDIFWLDKNTLLYEFGPFTDKSNDKYNVGCEYHLDNNTWHIAKFYKYEVVPMSFKELNPEQKMRIANKMLDAGNLSKLQQFRALDSTDYLSKKEGHKMRKFSQDADFIGR